MLLDGKDVEPVIQPASREAPAATAADEDEAKRQEQDYKKDEMSGRRAAPVGAEKKKAKWQKSARLNIFCICKDAYGKKYGIVCR